MASPSKPTKSKGPHRVEASRSVVIRDFAIFQVKLLLDAAKDGVLAALSVGALVLDLVSGGGRRPRLFYSVLAMSERFDLWLNLSGAVSRLEDEQLGEDGLFGASDAGSDSLLGRIEELVRGVEESGPPDAEPTAGVDQDDPDDSGEPPVSR